MERHPQQVGSSGMDVLCQAFLPLATATKTGALCLACDLQCLADLAYLLSLVEVIFATPSTTTMTVHTTDVAVETVFETSGVFVSLSESRHTPY